MSVKNPHVAYVLVIELTVTFHADVLINLCLIRVIRDEHLFIIIE